MMFGKLEQQDSIYGRPASLLPESWAAGHDLSLKTSQPSTPRCRTPESFLGYALAASPRIMSYRSITAATPIRAGPSSVRRSTRTTFPRARTNTSVPCVISAGSVSVISNSEPASKILLNDEIQPARRNIARLSFLGIYLVFGRNSNDDWQGQIITTSRPAFRHSPDLR